MKFFAMKFIRLALLAPFFLLIAGAQAAEQTADNKAPATLPTPVYTEPNLADIIPLATDLSTRLIALESRIKDMPDIASIDEKYANTRDRLEVISHQLEMLKDSHNASSARYYRLIQRLVDEGDLLASTNKPLADAIGRLDKRNKGWQGEKVRWSMWQTSMPAEQTPEQLRLVFEKSIQTINKAQGIISQNIDTLLAVQMRGAEVKSMIDERAAEVRTLIDGIQKNSILSKFPPMYSPHYFSQFGSEELWVEVRATLEALSWPDTKFIARHGVAIFLLYILMIGIAIGIYRNRQTLGEIKQWHFVAERPISSAVFCCALIMAIMLRYWEAPAMFLMTNIVVGGTACALLLGGLFQQYWEKKAAYSVMIGQVATMILFTSGLPMPLFRLYVFVASFLALIFCLRWMRIISGQNEPRHYAWALRLVALLCAIVLIAQLMGEAGLANYLFQSSLMTLSLVLAVALFSRMVRGGLHWVFFSSPVWQIKLMRSDAENHVRAATFLAMAAIVIFVLFPSILAGWGVYASYPAALDSFLEPGFDIGDERISIGLILAVIATLYTSFFVASIVSQVLLDEQVTGEMERGARISISRLLEYFLILVGFLVTLAVMGFDWTKLTIILSAFGIGIGFGLQSIVNNFVSGLILLFERPLREGDTIALGDNRVHIKKIGLRATHVQTFDQADVIVPNADLVNNQVTNWTLSNRQMLLTVPVGVGYGSDIGLVEEVLLACAKEHDEVLKSPAPVVLFMNFGESSLDFELRVWIQDADDRLTAKSQLYHEILQKFRERNIEIPFPQRDLHLHTAD